MELPKETYTHGHHESVLRSHTWRTAQNSAAYLLRHLRPGLNLPWIGVLLDRTGTKTAVPVTVGERPDSGSGQRWLTADVTLAPLGAGDYVIDLRSTAGREQRRPLVAIRVTQ